MTVQHTGGQQQDVVIAVMGTTGSGKSSFIRLLTGDTGVKTSGNLDSETSEIQVVRFRDHTSGREVILVDTPGFNRSHDDLTDVDILRKIADFLAQEYDKERKLNGLIYVQRVSDPKFNGQSSRSLRMFRGLCGEKNFKNVVILTTFWDKAQEEGEQREEQLKSKFFKDLVVGGARFMRHNGSPGSAHDVLKHIFTLMPANVQIQEDIRVQGKRVEDTTAGSVSREQMDQIVAEHQREVAELKAGLDAASKENLVLIQEAAAGQVDLRERMTYWESERLALAMALEYEKNSRECSRSQAVAHRQSYDEWHQGRQSMWSSLFESQAREYQEAVAKLQNEMSYFRRRN